MNKKVFFAVIFSLLVSGCQSNPPLYDWGQYEQTLFVVYHEPDLKEEAISNYISFVTGINSQMGAAPGLYAEAGTFLLERGDVVGAIEFYRKEYNAWPESRPMMEMVISNLEAAR